MAAPTLTPAARTLLHRLQDVVCADPRASLADGLAAARELLAVLEHAVHAGGDGPPEAA